MDRGLLGITRMAAPSRVQELAECALSHLDAEKWSVYHRVLRNAEERGIEFAVGGGFATMAYTAQPRNSKDLDVFIMRHDREKMIDVLTEAGLRDYFEQEAYDRSWIYRGSIDGAILDVIWSMANQRAMVDRTWIDGGPRVTTRGVPLRLVPPEETLWCKLYILQHERCDWPDALNLIYTCGPDLDWRHLLDRLGDDTPLLAGVLSVFAWACADRARQLPEWLWSKLDLSRPHPDGGMDVTCKRANLLDTRPWFTPTIQMAGGVGRC